MHVEKVLDYHKFNHPLPYPKLGSEQPPISASFCLSLMKWMCAVVWGAPGLSESHSSGSLPNVSAHSPLCIHVQKHYGEHNKLSYNIKVITIILHYATLDLRKKDSPGRMNGLSRYVLVKMISSYQILQTFRWYCSNHLCVIQLPCSACSIISGNQVTLLLITHLHHQLGATC